MNLQTCRTCLQKNSKVTNLGYGSEYYDKLELCIPEINMCIISKPVICRKCINMLKICYKFRQLCLQTEENINRCLDNLYLKRMKHIPEDSLDNGYDTPEYVNQSLMDSFFEQQEKESQNIDLVEEDVNSQPLISNEACKISKDENLESERKMINTSTKVTYKTNKSKTFTKNERHKKNTRKTPLTSLVTDNVDKLSKHNTSKQKNIGKKAKRGKKRKILVNNKNHCDKFKSFRICVICDKVFNDKKGLMNHVIVHI